VKEKIFVQGGVGIHPIPLKKKFENGTFVVTSPPKNSKLKKKN